MVILLRGIPITDTFLTGVIVQGIDALLSWTPVWEVYRSLDIAVLSRDCCNAAYYVHKHSYKLERDRVISTSGKNTTFIFHWSISPGL